ncbi:DNA-binding protein H-NS [Cupriavidus gilardii J11]|uniref:DNA-binding protein H-NS n=1 Tax=Cupriavidus gilardii J11 TaxID=936133 RepID=A0A562BLI9_9BURK|nr:DNA-binding protein H-NS [Cupriavidus gilardii J11]
MSEFDKARLAAIAWIRAQMDRYGLSLDDLEAAGCFSSDGDSATVLAPERAGDNGVHADAPASKAGTVLYRNALGQSWDGTGEMPDWLQRAVNAGQSAEFYRVD